MGIKKQDANSYRTINRDLVLIRNYCDVDSYHEVIRKHVLVESDQYFFCNSIGRIECISKDQFCDITKSADASRVIKSHISQIKKLHASLRDRIANDIKREREDILRKIEEEV